MTARFFLVPILSAAFALPGSAFAPPENKVAPTDGFATTVSPFLNRHCKSCHNEKLKTGSVSLEFSDSKTALSDVALWEEVTLKLRNGQMPPAGLPRPAQADVRRVVGWIDEELNKRHASAKIDPGRVTVRRLNRAEYNQTIRDLFGVSIRPAGPVSI